ncbi:MAG: hypothetical protein H6828_03140 [Planctomycetes bacterium]|nr:hypothetical protein [Planctomycetota bacterium]
MKPPTPPRDPANQALFHKSERNRLIFMSVLLVGVLIAFVTALTQQGKHQRDQDERARGLIAQHEPEFTETVVVPPFEAAAQVAPKIQDSRPDDWVLLPSEVLQPYVDYTRGMSDVQFQAMELQELTPELHAALLADPGAFRAEPFRVRGFLGDIKSVEQADGTLEYRGWLTSEHGDVSHFVVTSLPDEAELDGYMRVDGLFLKLYRGKGQLDEWAEGPLFVGSRAVRSYPPSEPYDRDVLAARLDKVTDDTAQQASGLDGAVFNAQWLLMGYALDEASKEIDWDAVPELGNAEMVTMIKNGAADRGQPFRIPVSKNMGSWTEDPGENPLRLDHVTTGWIGNWTWSNQAGVIQYVMPAYRPDLQTAELVSGKGFFLKNFNYEPRDGGTRQAPYFVLTELEAFVPVESNTARHLMWFVGGLTVLLLILLPVLLRRDRRRSEELQRDLVRRKQERRRRLATQGVGTPPQG